MALVVAILFIMTAVLTPIIIESNSNNSVYAATSSVAPAANAGNIKKRNWSTQFMAGGRSVSRDRALQDARTYAVIAAHFGAYREHVAAMKTINSKLMLVVYINGAATSDSSLPSDWWLRDKNGNRVYSRGWPQNHFLNILKPEVRAWIVERAVDRLNISGYDGVFVDMLGPALTVPGYTSAPAINPTTNAVWTRSEWLDATKVVGLDVQRAIGSKPMIANGLVRGNSYFNPVSPTKTLFNTGMVYGMSEIWLRDPFQSVTSFRSESAWKSDVDMIKDADASGYGVGVTVKAWAAGTQAQKDRYHEYALASFMLGTGGRSLFNYSYKLNQMNIPHPWDLVNLGKSLGAYKKIDGIYRRDFSAGIVLVNPARSSVVVNLNREMVDLRGKTISSITVKPNTGYVLRYI